MKQITIIQDVKPEYYKDMNVIMRHTDIENFLELNNKLPINIGDIYLEVTVYSDKVLEDFSKNLDKLLETHSNNLKTIKFNTSHLQIDRLLEIIKYTKIETLSISIILFKNFFKMAHNWKNLKTIRGTSSAFDFQTVDDINKYNIKYDYEISIPGNFNENIRDVLEKTKKMDNFVSILSEDDAFWYSNGKYHTAITLYEGLFKEELLHLPNIVPPFKCFIPKKIQIEGKVKSLKEVAELLKYFPNYESVWFSDLTLSKEDFKN